MTRLFYDKKRVLVTGHTGFKGSWLSLWLLHCGSNVAGMALKPETAPSLFEQLNLEKDINHRIGDIRDAEFVSRFVSDIQPDIVFHLAAQALVRRSYKEPVFTWQTNLMGTINLLEALRTLNKPCAVVLITTDKVYDNHEWDYGYRETDHLGGHDPYSASKAAAEIAVSSWRSSYFNADQPIRIASARAGNVIGGGDWAEDRLIPDLVRAFSKGQILRVRNPDAVRPWQHVLEPLSGYLQLGQKLFESKESQFQDAFNFGPLPGTERSVKDLILEAIQYWPGAWEDTSDPTPYYESARLVLVSDRARRRLGWKPKWDFQRIVRETISWYRFSMSAKNTELRTESLRTIQSYEETGVLP